MKTVTDRLDIAVDNLQRALTTEDGNWKGLAEDSLKEIEEVKSMLYQFGF